MPGKNECNSDGVKLLLEQAKHRFCRLRLIWADTAYAGKLLQWLRQLRIVRKRRLDIVKRPNGVKGFLVLLHRWVVERTCAWLGRHRRMSKDYEFTTASSEAFIYIAMITLMVRKLAGR